MDTHAARRRAVTAQRLLDEAAREERWRIMRATSAESARIADGERAAHAIAAALRGHGVPDDSAEGLALTLACYVADELRARGANGAAVACAWERLAGALQGTQP